MKEFEASDLLIGLHQKSKLTDAFYGKLTNDLMLSVAQQIIIYRHAIPPSTATRLHLVIPRKAEFEPGFHSWAKRIALLANQISCRVDAYGGRGTLAALEQFWREKKYSVQLEQHIYNEWHDFISVANRAKQDHIVVFIAARRGTLSHHNYMEKLPEQLERYFSARNLMIVYPPQPASVSDAAALRAGVPVKIRE